MTYDEAKARIVHPEPPPFWVGDVAHLPPRWAGLRRAEATVIATSPGNRPLHLIAFGEREDTVRRANFGSARAGGDAACYADKQARLKPVILVIGPVHGQEPEGLTGLVNLIEIMETGKDLRGREQAVLRALGDACRLLIIPAGNPDGLARFEPRTLQGMEHEDIRFWGQGAWKDGSFCGYPACKRRHPMVGDDVGFLGCYFNDAGVNPMHDEFFSPMGPEAPAILRTAQDEAPDLAVSLHSHGQRPEMHRPAFVPLETQQEVRELAVEYYALCEKRGLPYGKPFELQPETAGSTRPFNLASALYHTSGAPSFTFECPHGVRGDKHCQVSLEQILEIQLTLYESMMKHALSMKPCAERGQPVEALSRPAQRRPADRGDAK